MTGKSAAAMKLVMQRPADVLPSAQAVKVWLQSSKVFICSDCVGYSKKQTYSSKTLLGNTRGGVFLEFIIPIQLQMLLYLGQDWPHFFVS